VVEQRIQELQKNTGKRQEFEEELIRRKRKKAEEMGLSQDIKLRNAKLAVGTTKLAVIENKRVAALDNNDRREQVSERHARNLESLHKRRIMWVQREQTRRQEREEQERIREEAEAIDRRVKFWLTSLSYVSFAVNGGQRFKAKLEAIAQRERESHAAGKIGSEFLRFWSVRRRRQLYHNVITVRCCILVFIRQTNLCVHLWAAPLVADFLLTRVGDQRTSGSVTIQIKAFMIKIRRLQNRWRRIKIVRHARVFICTDFFREMEQDLISKRRRNKKGGVSAPDGLSQSLTVSRNERLQFPAGGTSKISGDIQAASGVSRRSSAKSHSKRSSLESRDGDEERERPEDLIPVESLPDQVVADALYTYVVRRQHQYYDDLKRWHEKNAAEQFDLDLQGFTMTSDEVKRAANPKPSPMDPLLVTSVPKQYDLMYQFMEDTRFRWEMQMLKDMQSPENKHKLTKRRSSAEP
jgi:hypothetical protein